MDKTFSDTIDNIIKHSIQKYDGSVELGEPFEELIGIGELVDRLSIVNYKLYNLKDRSSDSTDERFLAWSAKEDIRLVKERSRLKNCIDKKIVCILEKLKQGQKDGGLNQETKLYKDKNA